MSRYSAFRLGLVILVVVLLSGLAGLTAYYSDLPSHVSQHETIILGQNRFVPGSQAALRILVRDSKDASPLANATVKILLRPAAGGSTQTLFTGTTDNQGTADVAFTVPAQGEVNQTLIVETRSSLGSDRVERAVTLERDYRVLLSTDKPLYQPG